MTKVADEIAMNNELSSLLNEVAKLRNAKIALEECIATSCLKGKDHHSCRLGQCSVG